MKSDVKLDWQKLLDADIKAPSEKPCALHNAVAHSCFVAEVNSHSFHQEQWGEVLFRPLLVTTPNKYTGMIWEF